MKIIYFAILLVLAGCSPTENQTKKSKTIQTDDGNIYRIVCIDRVSYIQSNSNGNLTPHYEWQSHYPTSCSEDK
jgi:hypothetical protein